MKKVCSKCKELKELSEFYKNKTVNDGLHRDCKRCADAITKQFLRTKAGVINTIYSSQRSSSRSRNHSLPTYTKQELKHWIYNQPLFHELYHDWKMSGYKKELKPSCDRTKDNKGYDLSRLKLMTWGENQKKGFMDRINGFGTQGSVCKAVIQLTLHNEFVAEFHSISHATRMTKIRHISEVCNGVLNTSGNYKWKFKI